MPGDDSSWRVREATSSDVPRMLGLIRELADYERELHQVEATEDHLYAALFPEGEPSSARSHAIVAEVTGDDGRPRIAGLAVYYLTYSTWTGKHGIWLEDLFVQPDQRGNGLGTALLGRLAAICVERGFPRLEWWVLDWNEPSIGFYRSLGAVAQDEWTVYRITGDALRTLAQRS